MSVSDNELSLSLAAVSDNLEVSLSDNERSLLLQRFLKIRNCQCLTKNGLLLLQLFLKILQCLYLTMNTPLLRWWFLSIRHCLCLGSEHVSASAPFPVNPMLLSETGNPLTSASSFDRPCFVSEVEDPLSLAPFSVSSVSESEQRLSPVSVSQHSFSCAQSSGSIKACSAASSSWTVGDRHNLRLTPPACKPAERTAEPVQAADVDAPAGVTAVRDVISAHCLHPGNGAAVLAARHAPAGN